MLFWNGKKGVIIAERYFENALKSLDFFFKRAFFGDDGELFDKRKGKSEL